MLEQSTLANCTTRSTSEFAQLKQRFMALWQRCFQSSTPEQSAAVFIKLYDLYGEAHRHYHTIAHIKHCLKQFDLAAGLMENPDQVELGLWFHDAIYLASVQDNERRSADLLRSYAGEISDQDFLQEIDDLIMATTHREVPEKCDAQFIVDIDLSSFALPWEAFMADGARIRAEFPHLEDADYYTGHLQFLHRLYDREYFFCSDYFRANYEATAQANLKRLIADLAERGYI